MNWGTVSPSDAVLIWEREGERALWYYLATPSCETMDLASSVSPSGFGQFKILLCYNIIVAQGHKITKK